MTSLVIDKYDESGGLFLRVCAANNALVDITVNSMDDITFTVYGLDGSKSVTLSHEDSLKFIQAIGG